MKYFLFGALLFLHSICSYARISGDGQTCSWIEGISSDLRPIDELAGSSDDINATMTTSGTETNSEEARRFELFRFEKDYNQKNVLHYGIKVLPTSCSIEKKSNGAPNFNSYWIMGEEHNQVEGMTSDDIQRFGAIVLAQTEHSVTFKMNAMKDIPINKKEITLEANLVDGQCRVFATAELNDGRKVILDRFFAKISTVLGVPTGVSSLKIEGKDKSSGASISVEL